jgi:hypothetical protein
MNVRRTAFVACLAAALTAAPVLADSTKSAQPDGKAKSAQKDKAAAAKPKNVKAIRKRPAPRSMREALLRLKSTRVNVDFKEMEFARAVKFIGNVAGFDVIVSPELQAKGLSDVAPITLRLRNVTVKQLAELVERFTKTKMHFRKGILEFTTKKAARGKPVMRIYSIGEITTPMRHFPGPDINLYPAGAEFEREEETLVESAFGNADSVAELIQSTIESETWEDDNTSIQAYTGKLIVKTYPHVHRKVLRLLNQLRAHR